MIEYIYKHTNGEVIATYSKGGKLKKLIAKRGFLLNGIKFQKATLLEEDLNLSEWELYTPEKDNFYSHAQKAWFKFYTGLSGLEYRFTAADGGALKQIGKHLTAVTGSTYEAMEAWRFVLQHWNRLEPFYRNNADLKFINSQLNKILNQLKNGKQTGTATKANNADDLRRGFTS